MNKSFEKRYGKRPAFRDVGLRAEYSIAKHAYENGWKDCMEWMDEQDAMDRDYQLEQQENERLRRGQ